MRTIEIRLVEDVPDGAGWSDDDQGKTFHVRATDAGRLTHYGFGTFLEDIDPPEVWVTPEALALLLAQPERDGFQGIEFWPSNMMAWACPYPEIYVHPSDVNVPEGAKAWIRRVSVLRDQEDPR